MPIIQRHNIATFRMSNIYQRRRATIKRAVINIPLARRLALSFLIPALLATFTLAGIAIESEALLAHESSLYQHLIHTYTALNDNITTLDEMHTNLLGALNDARQITMHPETLDEDLKTLHQLELHFTNTFDSYRQQDMIHLYADLTRLFTKTGHQDVVIQQQVLTQQVQEDWYAYRTIQEKVLHIISLGDEPGARALTYTVAEQAYASAKTSLFNLVAFNSTLIPSISSAIQLDETTLLVLLYLTGLSVVLGMCIVGLLIFKTVIKRLHKVRNTITTIENGRVENRLPVEGRDEITSVSTSINSMLDRIVGLLEETRFQRDELANAEVLKHLHEELQAQHKALNTANERLATLAISDPLTNLPNHRAVMDRIEDDLSLATRTDQPFALLFLDVDHFKHINDTWGHRAGDMVLCEVARRLKQGIRREDFVGRYGGEEFAVLLTNIHTSEDAYQMAERLRLDLATTPCNWLNDENQIIPIPVTASIGIAVYQEHAISSEDLLEVADSAMYQAKHSGRNRICIASNEPSTLSSTNKNSQRGLNDDVAAIRALTAVAHAHDEETGAHAQRTVFLAIETAREMGCSPEEQQLVRLAALLHDIGKVGIPDDILRKPGPLTEDEWHIMRKHPKIGHQILAEAGGKFELLSHIVIAHHERWDGKGYPYGLIQDMIPLGARILTVVDSFDAMTSDRPYRKALPEEAARAELQSCAGTQFDPHVVTALLTVLTSASWRNLSMAAHADTHHSIHATT